MYVSKKICNYAVDVEHTQGWNKDQTLRNRQIHFRNYNPRLTPINERDDNKQFNMLQECNEGDGEYALNVEAFKVSILLYFFS